ncbi:MAG: hypothetical protein U0528_15130 [Anaerolineae bacterium]|nr:hypothetical protein [Anaerolineae bacterium]
MAVQKFTLKRDQYRTTRGGYARFLNLYCSKCGNHLLLYQKDGPGTLFRLYLDRIVAPSALSELQKIADLKKVPPLVCSSCQAVIGTAYVWEEENRPAFLLDQAAFSKKVGKGIYPPQG